MKDKLALVNVDDSDHLDLPDVMPGMFVVVVSICVVDFVVDVVVTLGTVIVVVMVVIVVVVVVLLLLSSQKPQVFLHFFLADVLEHLPFFSKLLHFLSAILSLQTSSPSPHLLQVFMHFLTIWFSASLVQRPFFSHFLHFLADALSLQDSSPKVKTINETMITSKVATFMLKC